MRDGGCKWWVKSVRGVVGGCRCVVGVWEVCGSVERGGVCGTIEVLSSKFLNLKKHFTWNMYVFRVSFCLQCYKLFQMFRKRSVMVITTLACSIYNSELGLS